MTWKPDASELAFGSNHERLYSAFRSDIYGIRPDGGSLRRITNPPSRADLLDGGFPVGTVTGKVRNDYSALTTLLLYIQGAQEAVSAPAYSRDAEVSFTAPNVAVLGGRQHVVFQWQTSTANLHDLWILDRLNPTERWRLTNNGRSINPDWSRPNPVSSPTCTAPLTGVSLSGPTRDDKNVAQTFTANVQPGNATTPINDLWSSDGLMGGQGANQATYSWSQAGTDLVSLSASNCGGAANASHSIIEIGKTYIYLPLVLRERN